MTLSPLVGVPTRTDDDVLADDDDDVDDQGTGNEIGERVRGLRRDYVNLFCDRDDFELEWRLSGTDQQRSTPDCLLETLDFVLRLPISLRCPYELTAQLQLGRKTTSSSPSRQQRCCNRGGRGYDRRQRRVCDWR